ncbi:MAG: glyoxalase, partial [Mesorhizobium sp.]
MPIDDPFKHSTLGSGIFYKDPRAALAWLEAAFGFEPSMVVSDADGRLVHSE